MLTGKIRSDPGNTRYRSYTKQAHKPTKENQYYHVVLLNMQYLIILSDNAIEYVVFNVK